MRTATLISTIYCLLIYSFGFSQTPYQPIRVYGIMEIDGKLNEPQWDLAPVEDAFMQTTPVAGPLTTEYTAYRVLYDDNYLYIGITCKDSEANKLIRTELERDFSLGADDATGVCLDTYHDKTSGLCFVANTLNARYDAIITQDGASLSSSYNTYWDVKTHVNEDGYTQEYIIPFSSLRFESKESVIMGIRVARLIKRKNELTASPPCDPTTENIWSNLSFAREIEFKNLQSKNPFYISPYVIVNHSTQQILNIDSTAYMPYNQFLQEKHFAKNEVLDKIISNIGIDAKYGITKNLTLDLTINTDFAQAEVDDRIINLTKYEVNLPEKRSFFLESANNLSFGFPSGNTLFISRKIGREDGLIVPIIGGARLTGKVNGWQLGALNMQTLGIESDSIAPHNFTVLRTRKDIDSLGSFIGAIITNKLNTDGSSVSGQTVGLDFVKRITQQFAVEGGMASTFNNFSTDTLLNSTYFHGGVFKSVREGFLYSAGVDVLGKSVNPEMGYIDDNNYGDIGAQVGYRYATGEKSVLQYLSIYNNYSYRWRLDNNQMETFSVDLWPGMQFKNGAEINFSVFEYKIDSLPFDWALDEHNAISAGSYTTFNNSLYLSTPSQSKFFGSIDLSYGGFYSGDRFSFSPYIAYSISKHLGFSITYEYNNIQFEQFLTDTIHTTFSSNLIRWNISYNVNTKITMKLYTQFDDISEKLSVNLRFRYNPTEGTDLFIVYNQGANTGYRGLDPVMPIIDNQAFTIKFIKTFEL